MLVPVKQVNSLIEHREFEKVQPPALSRRSRHPTNVTKGFNSSSFNNRYRSQNDNWKANGRVNHQVRLQINHHRRQVRPQANYHHNRTVERIKEAQNRQKLYEDRSRRDVEFKVGEEVLLSTRNLKNLLPTQTHKFNKQFIGPFKIIQIVSPVQYKLELPTNIQEHPVFHISLLKPYLSNERLKNTKKKKMDSEDRINFNGG
jgi:hypothetical protein